MLYVSYFYGIMVWEVSTMKLCYDKRLSDPTYYAQQGFRVGKKTTTKNVKKFGKHSELLKITEDPLAYVKQEIQKMNEEYRVGKVSYTINANFNEKVKQTLDEASKSNWLNIGYFFLQYIMKDLQLKDFFLEVTKDKKITFDCYTITRFLTYARILDPCSKLATWDKLDSYYEKPDFDYQHILRFMDILFENQEEYLKWLYQKSNQVLERNPRALYYDCTNFYFECEKEDESVIDPVTKEVISGLRKFGVSKENRPNPIVEMGLIIDEKGIPLTMCIHPGNTNEQTTAIPLEKEVLNMLEGREFIYCADAGLSSYNIRKFNSMGGRAFIVTQSIKKLSDILKQAVFNDYDYRLLSSDKEVTLEQMQSFDRLDPKNLNLYNDYAYKILEADKPLDLGLYEEKQLANGKIKKVKAKGVLKQRIIITFSRKMMEYQRTVRNRQIERAKNILKRNDPEEIKKGPNDVKRFLKRITNNDKKDNTPVSYILDEEKIATEEKYDGFYAVATNLMDDAKEILEISRKRYKIEDCFRVMKTNLLSRPVCHRERHRIIAHFMICYSALLVDRLLECKLEELGVPISTEHLIETIKNLNVANIHDVEYMALYDGSKTLDALNKLTGLNLDFAHYQPKELNKKIKKLL